MSETGIALSVSGRLVWHALRCNFAERFQAWALRVSPRDYCLSSVQAVVDKEMEIRSLRAALEPFAIIGRPLFHACETGEIPNGASARYLKLDPLNANDFAHAAMVFDA